MIEAPISLHRETVRPEWIDYNGHMNAAYYLFVFDRATDVLLDLLGLGEAYSKANQAGTFALEAHVTYRREVKVGAHLGVCTQLIDYDAKRIHYFHSLIEQGAAGASAHLEQISLHVAHRSRRGTVMPVEALARLAEIRAVHDRLPRPAELGSVIGIRRKNFMGHS